MTKKDKLLDRFLAFPNHYSIVTGLYPAHHGLVDNTYLDVNSGQEYLTYGSHTTESDGESTTYG